MPPKFFITHSWENIEFARRLTDDLRRHGLDGFFDAYSIKPGDQIPSEIQRGLEACDIYVPVLSPAALRSTWSELEINLAITLNRDPKRNGRPRILPVIAETCTVPLLLRSTLYIDFVGRYDEALKELLSKGFGLSVAVPIPRSLYSAPQTDFQAPVRSSPKEPLPKGKTSLFSPLVVIATIVVILLLSCMTGYFVINNVLGTASTAEATVTPIRGIALLPSPTMPVVVPTAAVVSTNTPLPPPTPSVTVTVPFANLTATYTRVTVLPTATKPPVTSVLPTATVPNVPPGVYVTKLETVPPNASVGSTIGFKATFLNTTGSMQTNTWIVKVYQCPEQCSTFSNSYGETLRADINIPNGTSSFTTSQNINLGVGIRCDLVAIPHYIDSIKQLRIPFQTTKGQPLYQSIKVCQ